MSDLMQRLEQHADAYSLLGEKDLPALLREAAAALRAAPEGFVLVPVEPTEDMLMFMGGHDDAAARRAYALMLAASPQGVK